MREARSSDRASLQICGASSHLAAPSDGHDATGSGFFVLLDLLEEATDLRRTEPAVASERSDR